jgi:predicted ATP-dependent serine protease
MHKNGTLALFPSFKHSQAKTSKMKEALKSKNYSEVEVLDEPSIMTGNEKFDKFFSKNGGMVLTSVVLLTGSSGAGKTTLSVNMQKVLNSYKTSLYSREMSASAVKEQTIKIGLKHENAYICDVDMCKTFDEYMEEVEKIQPKVITIDSLQVIAREDYPGMSEEDAAYLIIKRLAKWAKENNGVAFIIGHVTKDNEFRGANTIMQMVDAHLEMIHHKTGDYRTISWGHKNRKGPLATLYYVIKDSGIEFYETEEYNASKDKRNFSEYIAKHANAYLDTLDQENENFDSFKSEYEVEIKKLDSIEDGDEHLSKVIILLASLSRKYGM